MSGGSNFIVITSVLAPTDAIRAFVAQSGWTVVVVGDRKTPHDWHLEGARYLSPDDQGQLGFEITKLLPWNHYSRKMIGYLYAIAQGANVIVDADDDNVPLSGWSSLPLEGSFATVDQPGWVNAYRHFTDAFVWPRGYPLRLVREKSRPLRRRNRPARIGIWQFLVNVDPDVDAVHRLVFDAELAFEEKEPLVLGEGTVCPVNSQNTLFSREAFPLLYLPAFVTFRFTDILRGLVAQPLLWARGLRLGFGAATVRQDRNPHDYLADFAEEIPMYLHVETVVEAVRRVVTDDATSEMNLRKAYRALETCGIVVSQELELLEAWIEDIRSLDV